MPITAAAQQALHGSEFPITAEYTYLNTATQGPLPNCTRSAIEQASVRAQFPETERGRAELHPMVAARTGLAQFLRVGEDDLVFTSNTTHGLNICAHGIDWRPGDNVVLPEREFPSVMRTWLNLRSFGVEVRCVPWSGAGPGVEQLMEAVDSHTRVVSCSAVSWDTGYLIDLEALGRRCAAAGCLLVVDGIQAVGAVELDLQALHISALAIHSYKWLVAGFGCGALYVAPNAIEQIRPRFVGQQAYFSEGEAFDSEAAWQPGARRYNTGGGNMLGLAALASSLGLIEQIGLPAIQAHNAALIQQLVDGLMHYAPTVQLVSSPDPARRASIVTCTLGDHGRDAALLERFAEQNIIVAHRPRGIRVSPHFYNSAAEIDAFLRVLAESVKTIR